MAGAALLIASAMRSTKMRYQGPTAMSVIKQSSPTIQAPSPAVGRAHRLAQDLYGVTTSGMLSTAGIALAEFVRVIYTTMSNGAYDKGRCVASHSDLRTDDDASETAHVGRGRCEIMSALTRAGRREFSLLRFCREN
jgi:hypothetical protein